MTSTTKTASAKTKLVIETFYWLPYCSTCVKAEQHLLSKGASIQKYVNLKENPLSKTEVLKLCKLIGGPDKLFSKRAMKYRSMGLDKMTLGDEDLVGYMCQEYTFIKRPVLVTNDDKILAGFSAKQYDALLGN
ncbi:MAG: arsenate reductase family protein [Vampirovibrionales bacterium]|nr:arsenate reductase family protein [Vampirovibrionales bacterium]